MLIAVAVGMLETVAVFVVDGRMTVVKGGEGKGARGSYGDTSLAFWSGDDVSCFETMDTLGSWQAKSWESKFVRFGSLVGGSSVFLFESKEEGKDVGCHGFCFS